MSSDNKGCLVPFWLKIWFWNPPFAPGLDVRMLRTAVRSLLQTSRQSKALPASAGKTNSKSNFNVMPPANVMNIVAITLK